MDIIILTGMSGSGKSRAADYLEDMGYFCIDNLPPQLLNSMIHAFLEGQGGEGFGIKKLAFVVDVRSSEFLDCAKDQLEELRDQTIPFRILFLDSDDQVLIRRYKQTRRNHPLADEIGLSEALKKERKALTVLRKNADDIIDTTNMSVYEFRNVLYRLLKKEAEIDERISVLIVSFGFKYGLPLESDEVMDVRFIKNPYYDPALRPLCGLDREVRETVLKYEEAQYYLDSYDSRFAKILPFYIKEGKVRMTISVGCTGGRHRSVAMAEELARRLRKHDVRVMVHHRDITKDPQNDSKELSYGSE